MRAIVRFSINGEGNNALRNKLEGVLGGSGFDRLQNTATYQTDDIDEETLGHALTAFRATIHTHADQNLGPGRIDHFWMYTDRAPMAPDDD